MIKKGYIALSVLMFTVLFPCMELMKKLKLSSGSANKIINIINAYSTVATIISVIAIFFGAGAISTAIISSVKYLIKKYGKKYAVNW